MTAVTEREKMDATFEGKRISGILSVLPETESYFDDEAGNYDFPEKQTLRLKKIMGFNKHRLAKRDSTASAFCIAGLNYLIDSGKIKKEEIGAVVVVTLSPDHFLPQISNIIHGECGLGEDVLCMDIPQGCCGYLLGLFQSFMVLEHMKDKKVLLFNADVLSHKVSRQDRNDFPLIGDVSTVSIIENSGSGEIIHFRLYTDGQRRNTLMIPAGGFAMPCTEETAELKVSEDGNKRSLDNLHMDGAEVFNFVQTEVPPMINEMLSDCNLRKEEIDYFLFHQPNKFMLQKLADKVGIPHEKCFMNIVENYGNPSGASIPVNITLNLKDKLLDTRYLCCLAAFGSGLTWGTVIIELGDMEFCEEIETDL